MRFKNVLMVAAVAVLVAAVPSFASTTADKGLGLYEYSWFIDGVESYVFENPYYMSKYKNTAFAERIGTVDGINVGGIYFSPMQWLTVGLNLGNPVSNSVWNTTDRESLFNVDNYSLKGIDSKSKHSTSLQSFGGYQAEMLNGNIINLADPVNGSTSVVSTTNGVASTLAAPTLRSSLNQQNANLAGAFDFGGWGCGLNFGYATSWANKRTGDATTSSSDEYDFVNTQYSTALGGFVKFNSKVSMDLGASWVMYQLSNMYKKKTPGVNTKMTYDANGAMDFGGNARINYQMTDNHRVHFNLKYQYLNRSTKGTMTITGRTLDTDNVNGKDTFSRTGQDIQFGVSDEFNIAQDVKAFVGFSSEYEMFSNKYSGKDGIAAGNNLDKYSRSSTIIRVPLIIGMEMKLSENWTGRFGLVQTIYQPITDSGKNITNMGSTNIPSTFSDNSTSATALNIGVGYKLGNLTFDWLASVDMLVTGPNVVSGKIWSKSDPTPMALAFAVTYNFDGLASSVMSNEPVKTIDTGKVNNPSKR